LRAAEEANMDEIMESGGSPEETILSTSEENLAGGSEPDGASKDELRQPVSLQKQIDALNAHIEESIERKFQSGKDRRISRLESEVKELNGELTKLLAKQGDASQSVEGNASPRNSARNAEADEEAGISSSLHSPRASHLIQPSGGGVPAPDLRREYERRLETLRLGDIAGLMELKREFRKRGLEVY
jgi:TolA-binding protein